MDQNPEQDLFESVNSPEAPVKSLVTVGEQQTESSKMDDQEPAPVSVTSPIISVDDEADGNNKEFSSVNEESKPIGANSPSEMNGNSPPRLEVTPPKVHISPEAGGEHESVKTGIGRPASSSLSPSRIPSRKNSSSIQTASGQSEAVNDDLKVLESRLERFVTRSSEGSEASDNSDLSGELGEGDLRADILTSHVSCFRFRRRGLCDQQTLLLGHSELQGQERGLGGRQLSAREGRGRQHAEEHPEEDDHVLHRGQEESGAG